jgi:hypothetical protein
MGLHVCMSLRLRLRAPRARCHEDGSLRLTPFRLAGLRGPLQRLAPVFGQCCGRNRMAGAQLRDRDQHL